MSKNVIITGASGMIGSLVLLDCLNSNNVSSVTSLVRKASGKKHKKLNEVLIKDFMHLDQNANYFKSVDIVYYCQGVYTGAASRKNCTKITVEYPKVLAKVLKITSQNLRFCLLSGRNADRTEKSLIPFAKDKGTVENILSAMGFAAFHTFRPAYIYPVTPRKEPNIFYSLSYYFYPLIKLLGPKTSIRSTELASTIFQIGLHGFKQEILENKEILDFFIQDVS